MSGFFGYARLGPHRYRERFGLAYEEFSVGQLFEHRPGVTITQQDNLEEALDTLNNAHLHYDLHYAQQTEWRRNLGVSTLTLQRLLGMTSHTFYRRRNLLGIDRIAMTRPVFGGDTLYARTHVVGMADGDDECGVLSLSTEGRNERGEMIARIEYRAEVFRTGRHPEETAAEAAPLVEDERFRLYHTASSGALVEQTGLYFEDLAPGETFVHWPGRSIGFAESSLHALRSLDIQPRWSDPAYLRKHAMQPTIFEPLVIGLTTALSTRTLGRVVANLGWTGVELPRPVLAGETITAESTIGAVRASGSRPDQGIVEVETRAFVETGELVCRYQRALLVYRRGHGPYVAAGY